MMPLKVWGRASFQNCCKNISKAKRVIVKLDNKTKTATTEKRTQRKKERKKLVLRVHVLREIVAEPQKKEI
jgi:hypothetical protein